MNGLQLWCECEAHLSSAAATDTLQCNKCKSYIAINEVFYHCNNDKCEIKRCCVSCTIIKASGLDKSQLINMRRKYISQLAAKPSNELTAELGRIYAENVAFRHVLMGDAKIELKLDDCDDNEYGSEKEFWNAMEAKAKEKCDTADASIIASLEKYALIYNISANVEYNEGINRFLWRDALEYNRLKVIRYLLQRFQFSEETIDKSIEFGIGIGTYVAVRILQSSKRDLMTQKEALAMEANRSRMSAISETFIGALKENKCDLKNIISALESALIYCIEGTLMNRRKVRCSFPGEVMAIVVKYYQSKGSLMESRLWKALNENITEALDIRTVSHNKFDWIWFKDNLFHSTIWLESIGNGDILFSKLVKMVDNECGKQKHALADELSKMIVNETESWQRLIRLDRYSLDKSGQNNQCRQDRIRFGLTADESDHKLRMQSLIGESDAFAADKEFDLGVYLTSLIIRAHRLNPLFQRAIQSYFGTMIGEKRVEFQSGPVKESLRCRIKAELDYSQCDFPTCARIVDSVRASVVFDDIQTYIDSIEAFIDYIDSGKDAHLTQIIAIKNGFYQLTAAPHRYRDVKFIIAVTNEATKEAIIAELQFLLRPILETKKANHELYEIRRFTDVFLAANEAGRLFGTIETQLKCAIDDTKPNNAIAKIVNNNPFVFKSDSTNNLLSRIMALTAERKNTKLMTLIHNTFGEKLNWDYSSKSYGYSILHCAVYSDDGMSLSQMCEIMPKQWFDRWMVKGNKYGYTPLHMAVYPHVCSRGLLLSGILFKKGDCNPQLLKDAFNTVKDKKGYTVRDGLSVRLKDERYAHEKNEWNQLLESFNLEPI